MEYTKYIFHIASEFGFTPLNLVLVAMLYFLGAQHGFFPKFWKSENSNEELPATRAQMNKLSNYYNHDTTEILKSIETKLGNVHGTMESVHTTMESVEDVMKELKHHHMEMKEYGVKVRK